MEDLCTRILYFFNTLDTYFLLAGIGCFLLATGGNIAHYPYLAAILILFIVWFRLADFHPLFILYSLPVYAFLTVHLWGDVAADVFIYNLALLILIQIFFMGIPDSIVGRDPRILLYKIYNSLFTLAPTTVSLPVSLYYSSFLSLGLLGNEVLTPEQFCWLQAWLCVSSCLARWQLPKNRAPTFEKYPATQRRVERVVVLNIDGCRMDVFHSLSLPNIDLLKKSGATCDNGLHTVYRALTNPAFASILTGAFPKEHRVVNNNFGQSIQTEGLPDKVATKLYGSMHVKHFSKAHWDTSVISLPTTSIYRCDEEMVGRFMRDFETSPGTRLFVLDFSEADFLGHAYGSTSRSYRNAIGHIDQHIGNIYHWLAEQGALSTTAIIVCSDHGMKAIDHSYLLFQEEKFVPFITVGPGIRQGFHYLRPEAMIVDICANICYLLGIEYPKDCHGRVFLEIMEGIDAQKERENQVLLFNKVSYDIKAATYDQDHPEVVEGDRNWWEHVLRKHSCHKPCLSVLDFGCGTGFVGEIFLRAGMNFKTFVCCDVSEKALEKAREKLGGDPRFVFLSDFSEIKNAGLSFDIITLNSVLHHLFRPVELMESLRAILNEDGYVIGAHEPNRSFFNAPMHRILGELYKKLGHGVEFADDTFPLIEEKLRQHGYTFPIKPQQVQQLVEFHSPVDQHSIAIDLSKGFDPETFFSRFFPGYDILEKRLYSTALTRKSLPIAESVKKVTARILFGDSGNLISYVVHKPKLSDRRKTEFPRFALPLEPTPTKRLNDTHARRTA